MSLTQKEASMVLKLIGLSSRPDQWTSEQRQHADRILRAALSAKCRGICNSTYISLRASNIESVRREFFD